MAAGLPQGSKISCSRRWPAGLTPVVRTDDDVCSHLEWPTIVATTGPESATCLALGRESGADPQCRASVARTRSPELDADLHPCCRRPYARGCTSVAGSWGLMGDAAGHEITLTMTSCQGTGHGARVPVGSEHRQRRADVASRSQRVYHSVAVAVDGSPVTVGCGFSQDQSASRCSRPGSAARGARG